MSNPMCDKKMLQALESLEDIQKLMSKNNKIARIILEETIAEHWIKLKEMIYTVMEMIPSFKQMVVWKIDEIKNLIIYIEKNLILSKLGPCYFANFLEEFLIRKQTKDDILFLKYIVSEKVCNRVFKKF